MLTEFHGKKCLFLDRDGVINVDTGYVYRVEDFKFIDGIFDVCRDAIGKGYVICIVTNQAGIGRGYYTQKDFKTLTDWMCGRFISENILISKVYFSPYHPVYGLGKYKKDDESRKPNPGMIFQAANDLGLDLGRCVLIGDKVSDVQAGFSAGVRTNVLFGTDRKTKQLNFDCYKISQLSAVINLI